MATEQIVFQRFSLLTEEQKAAVLFFIETMLNSNAPKQVTPVKKRGGYGILKGKIWMAPDFDEPLEEMKEYMY